MPGSPSACRRGGAATVTDATIAPGATADEGEAEGGDDEVAVGPTSALAQSVADGDDTVPLAIYVTVGVIVLLPAFGPPTLSAVLRRGR